MLIAKRDTRQNDGDGIAVGALRLGGAAAAFFRRAREALHVLRIHYRALRAGRAERFVGERFAVSSGGIRGLAVGEEWAR